MGMTMDVTKGWTRGMLLGTLPAYAARQNRYFTHFLAEAKWYLTNSVDVLHLPKVIQLVKTGTFSIQLFVSAHRT
jgi:hypothetical protein